MVVLGVDPGTRRIGVAISDSEQKFALPLEVVDVSGTQHIERLVTLANEREVKEIVVGLPIRLDGSEGPAAEQARRLAEDIEERVDVPVVLVDERLTTVQAGKNLSTSGVNSRRARGVVDAVAAAVLLQTYLDSRKRS